MIRTPVESSNIRSIGWEAETLEVEFNTGLIYQYAAVSKETFDALMASNSKGQFFNAHIKTKHAFTKMEKAA